MSEVRICHICDGAIGSDCTCVCRSCSLGWHTACESETDCGCAVAGHATWYVLNHFNDDAIVRGPFKTAEAAAAVRSEIEREHAQDDAWNESHNLWVSQLPGGRP